VLKSSPAGCGQTGCNSSRTRRSASVWRHHDVSTSYRLRRCRSTVLRCTQSALCGTWATVLINADLIMRTHVQVRTMSRCFAVLRQLRQVHRSVPPWTTFQTIISALFLTRLDQANSVLVGLYTSVPCSAAPAGLERFSVPCLWTSLTRPRVRRARQASLHG
jgi:hypothetical protein